MSPSCRCHPPVRNSTQPRTSGSICDRPISPTVCSPPTPTSLTPAKTPGENFSPKPGASPRSPPATGPSSVDSSEGWYDMAIVDDMAMFAVRQRSPAPQGDDVRGALEAFEPVVIKTHAQPVTDQAGGDRVKHLAQCEGAGCRDVDVDLLIVGGLADRQFLQRHPLLIDALGIARVAAANNLVDEAPPCRKIVEVARGTQQQGICQRSFEMAMRAFDRTILVRYARIVAGRRHAVMAAGRLVACRQILFGIGAEIAECGREAVASVLLGNPAQRPQGILQPFRQGDKTFAAEHDVGVLEAGERQTEVIEPAVQQLAGNGDAKIGDLGE